MRKKHKKTARTFLWSYLATFLFQCTLWGGAAVTSWYTAHSAFIQGIGPHWVVIAAAIVFFLVAAAGNLISLLVIRHRRLEAEKLLDFQLTGDARGLQNELSHGEGDEIVKLRAEVNELNEAIREKATQLNETHRQLVQSETEKDDASRAQATAESERDNLKKERDGLETERNSLSKSLEFMNQLKIADKSEIKNLVLVCGVMCRKATEGPAHLDFTFSILNMSLYVVSVESIEGYIGFHRDGILYKPKVPPRLESNSARNMAFRKTGHFVIEQDFLTEGETDYVLNAPKDTIHSLSPLKIIVTGDELEPIQLDLDKIFVKQDDVWLNYEERYFFSSGIAAQKAKEEIDKLTQEISDWKDAAQKGLEATNFLKAEHDRLSNDLKEKEELIARGCSATYLHRIADLERDHIGELVRVRECVLIEKQLLKGEMRKLVFEINVWNESVFDVGVEKVTGTIMFQGTELHGEKFLVDYHTVQNLPHRSEGWLIMEQRLETTEAELIADAAESGPLVFDLSRFNVWIKGGACCPEVLVRRLRLLKTTADSSGSSIQI